MCKRVKKEPERVADESQVRKPIVDDKKTITNKYVVEKDKPYIPTPPYKPKIPYP